VNDDLSLEVTISPGLGCVLDAQAHLPVLTIPRRHEVRIVVAGTVLHIPEHRVTALAALAKVVILLKVAILLIETVAIVGVMDLVSSVEQLGDREVKVLPDVLGWTSSCSGADADAASAVVS